MWRAGLEPTLDFGLMIGGRCVGRYYINMGCVWKQARTFTLMGDDPRVPTSYTSLFIAALLRIHVMEKRLFRRYCEIPADRYRNNAPEAVSSAFENSEISKKTYRRICKVWH